MLSRSSAVMTSTQASRTRSSMARTRNHPCASRVAAPWARMETAPVCCGGIGAAPPEVRAAEALDRLDTNERVAFLDEATVLGHDGSDSAAHLGLDFIEHFHRFHDADWLARLNRIADLDEWICVG